MERKHVRPSFRESFRKLSDEFTRRQHIGIIVGRISFTFFLTLAVVLAWRERFAFTKDVNSVVVVTGTFVWLTAIAIVQLQYIVTHLIHMYLPAEDPVKSKKLVVYFMETVIGILVLIPIAISLYGIFTIENFHFENVYPDQAEFFQAINEFRPEVIQYIGYLLFACIPIMMLYIIELSLLGGIMRPELQVHHILALAYTIIFTTSEMSSVVLQLSILQTFFAALEWPLFASLIHYRLTMSGDVTTRTVRRNMYIFSALRYFWAITRLAMVACAVYFIVNGFNYMSVFLRCVYPIALTLQIATLGMTQKELTGIHRSLVDKLDTSVKKKKATEERRRTMMSTREINITDA